LVLVKINRSFDLTQSPNQFRIANGVANPKSTHVIGFRYRKEFDRNPFLRIGLQYRWNRSIGKNQIDIGKIMD
jgi:hypothetical protein